MGTVPTYDKSFALPMIIEILYTAVLLHYYTSVYESRDCEGEKESRGKTAVREERKVLLMLITG